MEVFSENFGQTKIRHSIIIMFRERVPSAGRKNLPTQLSADDITPTRQMKMA